MNLTTMFKRLFALIISVHNRTPLPLKMVTVTVIVGLGVWAVLDNIQTRKLKGIFQAQLDKKLSQLALKDQLNFDRYVNTHYQSAKLFVSQKKFSDYIEKQKWSAEDTIQTKYYRYFPPWFPKVSVLRIFAQPRYAILLDSGERVREIYHNRQDPLPPSLLQPEPLLLAKSSGQNFVTTLNGLSYLTTSQSFVGSQGKLKAKLMLVSPIDDEFLIASMGFTTPGHIVALTSGERPRVLTSSNLELLPAGTLLDTIQDRYLITGQEFFDYGSSDLVIKLASLISTAEVYSLIKEVTLRQRQQRAIAALMFILTFALIIFWITRRIQQLTYRITDFSHNMLGVEQQRMQKGDQLNILEERFQRLTEEVIDVRDALKKESEAHKHLSLHDALTGLPNRLLLYDRLKQAILVAQRENDSLAVMMMDLDHFKEINDTLGHNIGDIILKQIGARLPRVLRKSDTVVRFGGDEFMVLLPSVDAEQARQTAVKLLNALEPSFVVGDYRLYVGASIGTVLCPDHGENPHTLIQRADVAMYVAKHARCGIANYDPRQDQYSRDRLVLINELRHTIENNGLILYYQPKIEYKTGRITGVEALIRWPHPKGLILPDEFVSMAEHTGLIKPLTQWVLETVLYQYTEWHRAGIEINVSINLSTWNLQDVQFPDEVARHLEMSDITPDRLELEITESAVMSDPKHAIDVLMRLDALGVRLSVDDYGIGYSSLAYLKKLPVDELKIDKSFVINMAVDDNDAAIVHSTIELAHNLGLKVIAEGVESRKVFDMLNRLGCDAAQGHYISPPLPVEELTRWLYKSPWGILRKHKASQTLITQAGTKAQSNEGVK